MRSGPRALDLMATLPEARDGEAVDALLAARGVRLERIVSRGQSSPPGFWYDQQDAEWVMVVAGAARVEIAGEAGERELGPGDTLYLPAGCRHRVSWTTPDGPTVWLALFIASDLEPPA